MNTNLLFNIEVSLDQVGRAHYRTVVSLFDVLGDLGGIMEIVLISLTLFLVPIAEHNYILLAAKKLFFARCVDEDIFNSSPNN